MNRLNNYVILLGGAPFTGTTLAEAIQWYANNRVEQQGVLLKNREMIETKISFEKNMKTISERYHALIDNHPICAE